jgi:hypothetical protein
MGSGDMADGVRHRQNGQPEGQGDTNQPDAVVDVPVLGVEKLRRQDGAATTAEDEPECAE